MTKRYEARTARGGEVDEIADAMRDVKEDQQRCMRCGSWFLDTGWECNDCGFDNIHIYGVRKP